MHMIGKSEVYSVAEILASGAVLIGRGDKNVLMDAYPCFWLQPDDERCWVSFSKDEACYMDLDVVKDCERTRKWIALRIQLKDIDKRVFCDFVRRLRDSLSLYIDPVTVVM